MKKRILCAILTLILLVSLVPVGALTASAATYAVSEDAITILKQLQSYTDTCTTKGYTGYGTKCTEKGTHGSHKINETIADEALREALVDVDKAVNSFASANGLALRKNQHDALVLFSFRNGTAWMSGTSDVKSAVTSGATGNAFLNMFLNWRSSEYDNDRRMIEANMYLNNRYSSSVPTSYIKVSYDPNGGKMTGNKTTFYYDLNEDDTILPTPVRQGFKLKGWYNMEGKDKNDTPTNWVDELSSICDGLELTAYWQKVNDKASYSVLTTEADYILPASMLANKYVYENPTADREKDYVSGDLHVFEEYVDMKGVKWAHIDSAEKYTYYDKNDKKHTISNCTEELWVKVGTVKTEGVSTSGSDTDGLDITVTVTNTYVNARDKASIYGGLKGTYNQGDKLRIVGKPVSKSGFLWGQVAKSATDATPVAWVALMYTDYEKVIAKTDTSSVVDNSTIVAKAHIVSPVNGYVNVRNGAGMNHTIVGSVSYGTMVDIYETKYVNGHEWGRCSQGWFVLSYADVTRLVKENNAASQLGFTAYAFTGKIKNINEVYTSPTSGEKVDLDYVELDYDKADKLYNGKNVTVTNITQVGADTWGKIRQGWIVVSRNAVPNNFEMDAAKFEVTASSATVREDYYTAADRVDTLSKGTEFNVTKIVADETTIWGYATKVGEPISGGKGDTYSGWVNLSSTNVKRNNAPILVEDEDAGTGKIATVINVDMVNVRSKASVYGGLVCKIPMGTTGEILDESKGWYRLKLKGREDTQTWVYGDYLSIKDAGSSSESGSTGSVSGTVETGKGIVANTYAGVNVRQTPGIGGAFLGKILPGTAVDIYETEMVGTTKWGRTQQGWISMDYVTMLTHQTFPGMSGSTGSSSTVTAAEPAIYTGTVMDRTFGTMALALDPEAPNGVVDNDGRDEDGKLIIFQTTDVNSAHVRKLSDGEKVTIHEILTVQEATTTTDPDNQGSTTTTVTAYWARVNDGYVRSPGNNLALDTLDEATYTLTDAEKLNAYDGLGSGDLQFTLIKGEQVRVTMVEIQHNKVYGFVEYEGNDSGWIDLSKMTKGAISVQTETAPVEPTNPAPVIGSTGNTGSTGFVTNAGGYKYTGKVINTNEVNVRASASTAAAITANLKAGASLVIYETMINEAMAWGRCDAGWVYLYYVDLTPAGGSAYDAKVVFNDNTIAYTDSSATEAAGTYARMSVIDIYEQVGNMVRTDLGWVHTDNLLG